METEKDISISYSYSYDDKLMQESLEKRHLYLNEEITDDVISSVVFHITRFNKMDEGIEPEKRKPIILFMNTPGGDVFSGFGVCDAIKSSITPVYTVNQALCASMGFNIFISGAKRFAMPHSVFLMHDGTTMTVDSTAKTKDFVDFYCGTFQKSVKEHVLNNTKISAKVYDKMYRKEWWILPAEAKECGIVDSIIGIDCDFSVLL